MPGQGRTRKDLTKRPVYQPDVKPIRIMAVLRGRRNVKRILREEF
jgi:hypothetical protein